MKESQKKPDFTISGLVRRDLKEMEDQRFVGRSREQVWEWFCQKYDLNLGKRTFYNLFYRARERAEKEQLKIARLAMTTAQPDLSVVPELATQKKPKKEPKKHVERAEDKPEVRSENVLPENATGLQRLRAALSVKVPDLDWDADDRFAKYRTPRKDNG